MLHFRHKTLLVSTDRSLAVLSVDFRLLFYCVVLQVEVFIRNQVTLYVHQLLLALHIFRSVLAKWLCVCAELVAVEARQHDVVALSPLFQ